MQCDAQTLVNLASRLRGIPDGTKLDILIALFCQLAGVPCDAQSLTKLGQCNLCNLPVGVKWDILMALFCQIANAPPAPPPLVAPVFTTLNAFSAGWTWSGANPAFWLVESSTDGGITWSQVFQVAGANRNIITAIPPGLYSVIGVDGSLTAVTARSNTLTT